VRTAPHLPHQALLLNFAAELAQRLLELLLVLDDDLQPWITSFVGSVFLTTDHALARGSCQNPGKAYPKAFRSELRCLPRRVPTPARRESSEQSRRGDTGHHGDNVAGPCP
jgi:hypothetical protein